MHYEKSGKENAVCRYSRSGEIYMKFRERYMTGEADFEELFDLTDEWNFSDETCTLREFLGLTAQEEDVWISESDEALEELMEAERKRKIFFTDLDGTLLDDQKELTEGNKKALQQLLSQGHYAVISTGRALTSAMIQAKKLGLYGKNCYIICFNGSQIYDIFQEKLICRHALPMELVRTLFDEAERFGINIQTYSDNDVLAEKDNDSLRRYIRGQGLECRIVSSVTEALQQPPSKLLALDYSSPEHVTAFREYVQARYQGQADFFQSTPHLLEIVPSGINKGTAVQYLCAHLAVPLKNTVAAGDAENDLAMIRAAHIGAAMCNGEALLKEKADYITTADNNHDGAAEIIQKFILS